MISKETIKRLIGLQTKKLRQKYSQFLVEGEKSIAELLKSELEIVQIYHNNDVKILSGLYNLKNNNLFTEVDNEILKKISVHQSTPNAIALVSIPKYQLPKKIETLVIGLDNIQDPGNLGTIIRIADWYGIEYIVCNKGCTDVYNPKCINSTMGSFSRVKVIHDEIESFSQKLNLPIFSCDMNGVSVHSKSLSIAKGIIVIGNEGHGVNEEIKKKSIQTISIPSFGSAESLNAAVSCAIIIDNLIHKLK